MNCISALNTSSFLMISVSKLQDVSVEIIPIPLLYSVTKLLWINNEVVKP